MKTDIYYGLNPSGGAHRATFVGSTMVSFETFILDGMSWQPADWAPYAGWIDWFELDDMPVEVQELEAQAS